MINNFEKMQVFQKAHQFTVQIYQITKNYPTNEIHRLKDQLCRAASSVPANIVEGNARKTKKEYIQFLHQAKGSLAETQYHLMLSKDLGYIKPEIYDKLIIDSEDIAKLLSGLIRYLRSTI